MDTAVELTWLVDADADEKRDYEVDNLIWTLDPALWRPGRRQYFFYTQR